MRIGVIDSGRIGFATLDSGSLADGGRLQQPGMLRD
jgi:hypothetical protein